MDKKKLKKTIVLVSIIIVILIVLFLIVFFSKKNQSIRSINKINGLEQDYSDYVMPLNRMELIDKYKGNLSNETIYTLMYRFATKIVLDLKKENILDANNYFEKNSEDIYINTGITDASTFAALVTKINKLPESLIFSEYKIKENSVVNENGNVKAILQIFYNNSEQELDLDIEVFSEEKSDSTSIIFN